MRDLTRGRFLLRDPVTVTLRRPAGPASGAAAVVVQRTQAQPVTEEPIDSPLGGTLAGAKRVFHVFRIECGGLTPYEGCEVQMADGTVWVIKQAETLAHGERFRLHTVQRQDTTQ